MQIVSLERFVMTYLHCLKIILNFKFLCSLSFICVVADLQEPWVHHLPLKRPPIEDLCSPRGIGNSIQASYHHICHTLLFGEWLKVMTTHAIFGKGSVKWSINLRICLLAHDGGSCRTNHNDKVSNVIVGTSGVS